MTTGTITWFHAILGCGVIAPDDGSERVLIRLARAEDGEVVQFRKGERLDYDTVLGADGRTRAANPRRHAASGDHLPAAEQVG